MKATIFELAQEYRDLFQQMCDGEPALLTKLAMDKSKEKLDDKIEAYSVMIKQFNSNIASRAVDIEELTKKNKKDEATVKYLKSVLADIVREFGNKRVTPSGLLAFDYVSGNLKATSSASESIDLMEDFENEDYGRYKVVIDNLKKQQVEELQKANKLDKVDFIPDKTSIANDIKEGVVIEGASKITKYGITVKIK